MSLSRERIVDLAGTVDGVNRNFTTPVPYESGSPRAVVNGAIYASTDDQFGLTEVSSTEIQLATAPSAGYVMQLWMRELVADGSPFHPTGAYP